MPQPKSYAKRAVKGSTIVFTALIVSGLMGFSFRVFLAHTLDKTSYGLFWAVFTLISAFALFRDLGLEAAVVKFTPEFILRKQYGQIKSSMAFALLLQSLIVSCVTAVLFVFSDNIALSVFKTESAALPIQILGMWLFTTIFSSFFHKIFQGFQNMVIYSAIEVLHIGLVFTFAVFFVKGLGFGVNGVSFAYLFTSSLVAVIGLLLFRKGYPQVFKANLRISRPLAKKLLVFALSVFVGGLGGLIISYTDTLTITIFRSLGEVGLYQVAIPASHILWYFPMALTIALFPMISELWSKKEQEIIGQALHILIKFSLLFIIPVALVFIAFPDIIIRVIFGQEYLAGATALQILAGGAVAYTLYAILVSIIAGIGKPIVNSKVAALIACINVGGDLVLVPIYGIEGAAVATFASYLLGLMLSLHFVRKYISFTVPHSSLLKTIAGGIVTLLFIHDLKFFLFLPLWLELLAVIIPALIFYGAWVLSTKAVTKEDLKLLSEILPLPRRFIRVAGRFIKD